jgi:hypothetical protein
VRLKRSHDRFVSVPECFRVHRGKQRKEILIRFLVYCLSEPVHYRKIALLFAVRGSFSFEVETDLPINLHESLHTLPFGRSDLPLPFHEVLKALPEGKQIAMSEELRMVVFQPIMDGDPEFPLGGQFEILPDEVPVGGMRVMILCAESGEDL